MRENSGAKSKKKNARRGIADQYPEFEQPLRARKETLSTCLVHTNKQLLDEVFAISGIIKVRLRLITITSTLIIPDIAKTESNNCLIIHCFTG